MTIVLAVVAILAVLGLIIGLKVEPVIALVLGALFLGLTAGLGLADTVGTIAAGFGDIMAEVGLLIGFGVLLGSIMYSLGALQRFITLLLRLLGARRLPYAMSAVMTALFPSIYVDVQLVLASPLARGAAPAIGRNGLPLLAGALTAGILVGYVFVVPGLGTIAVARQLDVALGTMLPYGLVVGTVTAVLATAVFGLLLKAGFWNPERDAVESEALAEQEADDPTTRDDADRLPPLGVSLLPILVPLVLIAFGAIAETAGFSTDLIAFLGDPVFALFVGLVGAYLLARGTIGRERTDEAVERGLATTGSILLITGIGGSLGAVIGATDLETVLGDLFSADQGAPVVLTVLLAWLVAAILHFAIGSIAVAGLAAASIIGPVLGSLDVAPVVVALAIGAGSLFALQVNSNFFWMFQSLLGVSTQGALKALTLVTSIASVVSLPMIIVLGFVL